MMLYGYMMFYVDMYGIVTIRLYMILHVFMDIHWIQNYIIFLQMDFAAIWQLLQRLFSNLCSFGLRLSMAKWHFCPERLDENSACAVVKGL
jgi:hypothetical protein